jgi:hypothetical protein
MEHCRAAVPQQVGELSVGNALARLLSQQGDEHLPPGHPLCFAGRGYGGPIPEKASQLAAPSGRPLERYSEAVWRAPFLDASVAG